MIEDATVQGLPPEQREQIGQLWLERARGELSTAAVFAHLASGVLGARSNAEPNATITPSAWGLPLQFRGKLNAG